MHGLSHMSSKDSYLRYVMSIAFGTEVMHHSVQSVVACPILLFTRHLYSVFQADNVVDLGEVHVPLAENKALQMDNQNFGQRVDFCLL